MYESYEVGSQCWLPSPTAGWVGAQVVAKRTLSPTEVELDLAVDATPDEDVVTKKLTEDPSPDVPSRNPPALEATSDLVTSSYLNEPSVSHAIRQRYSHSNIYTFSGMVSIATNPFDRVDNSYTDEVVQMYSGRERGELEPHSFSIAEDAFRCMQRDNKNQTIVVSGESGAGKTMSAKYIMRYFATVEDPNKRASGELAARSNSSNNNNGTQDSSLDETDDGSSTVEREILATNPIMEAFGNAKTTRNDNSSRFGKYSEIRFDESLEISGARIRTYLLERSRIVYHPETERNYHIFYQLMKGSDAADLAKLGSEGGLEAFHYVNNGSPVIPGVDDAHDFMDTRRASNIVGVDDEQQWRVFEISAASSHLGNIELKATSSSVLVSPEDASSSHAARLLGVPSPMLAKWLVKRSIMVRSEKSESNLDIKAATVVRDSISKYSYSASFDWLVVAVNSKSFTGNGDDKFIGVLDIYGFEHFKHNSFEQFCINYANEKSQQEFNQHVFKLEQEEYESEEIDWQYIDFVDNQPCITLIESKTGISGSLDDESRVPSGSDDGFTQKLYGQLTGKPNFRKPRLGENSFIVAHYAHDVEYETAGFIEKNRDTVPDTIIGLLQESENPFLTEILETQTKSQGGAASAAPASTANSEADAPKKPETGPIRRGAAGGVAKRPTLGNIFKKSLIELMETISSTNAHYIRCIKPNEEKAAWMFDGPMVSSQSRACGVLETIRISSKGFPGRHYYPDFAARYESSSNSADRARSKTPEESSVAILEKFSDPATNGGELETTPGSKDGTANKTKPYALGKTKVFSRAGILARLENKRTKRSRDAAVSIQRYVKMRYARSYSLNTVAFVKDVQTAARGKLARERAAKARAELALIGFQAAARRSIHRHRLELAQRSVIAIQQKVRRIQAQARTEERAKQETATASQCLIRAKQVRNTHLRQVSALTTVQSMIRRRDARRQSQKSREDQHSVKHFEEAQYRMENKVVELQNASSQKRDEHKNTLAELSSAQAALAAAEAKFVASTTEHGDDKKSAEQSQRDLNDQIEKHHSEIVDSRAESRNQTKQIEDSQGTSAEQDQKVQELTYENTELKRSNTELSEQVHLAQTSNIGAGSLMYQSRATATEGNGAPMPGHSAQAYGNGQAHSISNFDVEQWDEEQVRVNEQVERFLQKNSGSKEESITNLIKTLEYTTFEPNKGVASPSRDVSFPANITNSVVSEMWRFGFINDSEQLSSAVSSSIQSVVEKSANSESISTVAPFWMSNVHQIYSFMALAQANIRNSPHLREQMGLEELSQYSTLTDMAKADAESTIFNIYYVYMKYSRKMLDKLTVAAIIDDQNIPGFQGRINQGNAFMNFFTGSTHITMDDLVISFNKVLTPLETFGLEYFYATQILKEMVTIIGLKSFNDMIMRRNFLTWRRSVQINYNVTRLAEWSKFHRFDDAVSPLEHIIQASKSSQSKKNWDDDIDFLFDVFWASNPSQIHRIMANYQPLDYEAPVPQRVLQVVAEKIREDHTASTALASKMRPANDVGPFESAPPRISENLEPFIPSRVQAPKSREFTDYTTRASRLAEAAQMAYLHDQEKKNKQKQQAGGAQLPELPKKGGDDKRTNEGIAPSSNGHSNHDNAWAESTRLEK